MGVRRPALDARHPIRRLEAQLVEAKDTQCWRPGPV
jgi:hypothetical protein